MTEILIGIGTNLGDREKNIKTALGLISEKVAIKKVSEFFRNPPAEGVEGGFFINCALAGETPFDPEELLCFLQSVEERMGREKTHIRNKARIIDLDLLFYGDLVTEKPGMHIPHPGLHKRDFVLKCLSEIAPQKIHPSIGRSVTALWEELKHENRRKR